MVTVDEPGDVVPTTACPRCGGPTGLRASRPGATTCGGLTLPCARHCPACGEDWVPTQAQLAEWMRSHPGELVPAGPWRLASSGTSIDAAHIRIRLEGGTREERAALAAYLQSCAPTGDRDGD